MRNLQDVHRPTSVEEALALLQRNPPRTVALGGGTWLNGEQPRDIEAVVDLKELGLSTVTNDTTTTSIGATVTLQTLVEMGQRAAGASDPLQMLGRAAGDMAALNIRNRATVGGALCTADASSPLVTALLACDAQVVVHTPDKVSTLLLQGFLGYSAALLARGALITAVTLPSRAGDVQGGYFKVSRTLRDHPIVCAAVRYTSINGVCSRVWAAVGGIATSPVRLVGLEHALEQRNLAEALHPALATELATFHPQGDWLGSAEYRLEMAAILVKRCFECL